MSGSPQLLHEQSAGVRFDRITLLILLAAGVGALLLMAVRLHDATIVGPLNYNEGWNAYHALRYQQTGTPYPPLGGLVMNNYTPLWFPLLAFFGNFADNLVMAGRLLASISLIALLATVGAIGALIRGRNGALAAFVTVAFVFAAEANLYVGIADPQFVAQLACAIALLLAVRARSTTDRWYLGAMAVAVFAGFLKHNLAALPFALLVAAFMESPRAFIRAAIVSAMALVIGYLLSAAVGGMNWPRQLLSARVYTSARLFRQAIPFVTMNSIGLLLAVAGLFTLPSGHVRRVLAVYLLGAVPLAILFVGGEGVAGNIFFDSLIVMSLCASLFVGRVLALARGDGVDSQPVRLPPYAPAVALASFFAVIGVPQLLDTGLRLRHPEVFAETARAFQEDVIFLRNQPGNAVCYHLDLCYLAGKPIIYDPFNAEQALATGSISADETRALLARENVQVIHASSTKAGAPGIPAPMAGEVAAEFEMVRENANGAFYVRRVKEAGR